jgi:hypothetical protein
VWARLPRVPVLVVRGRIGEMDEADQEFEAGEVQVRPRPVGPDDRPIGDLPRRDGAAAVIAEDWDPGVGDEV